MLARTSSSDVDARCEAATTGRAPGPNMPPMIEQVAMKRGAMSRERRKDDNTDLQETVFSIGRGRERRVPGLNSGFHTATRQPLARDGLFGNFVEPPHLIADANQEHGLSRILEEVDNPILLVFKKDRLAVGEKVRRES